MANIDTGHLDLFSFNEIQNMLLVATLTANGVNPTEFLQKNTVTYAATIKPGVGMAIVITSVTPKPEKADRKDEGAE